MITKPFALALFCLTSLLSPWSQATAGIYHLDSDFAQQGLLYHSPGIPQNFLNQPEDIAVQADGRLIVVGSANNGEEINGQNDSNGFVSRFLEDGSLDPNFAFYGSLSLETSSAYTRLTSIAIQSDGKILLAGYHAEEEEDEDGILIRINVDGSLDTTFANDGVASVEVSQSDDRFLSLSIQNDGQILVAGFTHREGQKRQLLSQFNPDGSPDLNFAINGIFEGDAGEFTKTTTFSDGTAAGLGNSAGLLSYTFITNSGSLLSSGLFGHSTTDSASLNSIIQTNNGFLAAGTINGDQAVIQRITSAGTLDTTYASSGLLILPQSPPIEHLFSISPSRIVAVNHDGDFLGLNGQGEIDISYGIDGIASAPVALQGPGGAALNGNNIVLTSASDGPDIQMYRSSSEGLPDPSLNGGAVLSDGFILVSVPSYEDSAVQNHVMQLTDGRIISCGSSQGQTSAQFTISAYLLNGKPDPEFGDNGVATTQITPGMDTCSSLAIQGNKIIAAGIANGGYSTSNPALARYDMDGVLDENFGINGITTFDYGGLSDSFSSVEVLSDGSILAAGTTWVNEQYNIFFARFNSNGTLDETFGNSGFSEINLVQQDYFYAMEIQPNGKIVVAATGRKDGNMDHDFMVFRLLPDGALDSQFGANGHTIVDIGLVTNDYATDLVILPDGKIVLSGFSPRISSNAFTLVRFLANGQIDSSFASSGIQQVRGPGTQDYAYGMSLDADGNISVAGHTSVGGDKKPLIMRFDTGGSLISSFGDEGMLMLDIFGDTGISTIFQQMDGNLVVAGTRRNPDQFFMARLREHDDSDGDGISDVQDIFPDDSLESTDSDHDGTGDNSDAFVNNGAASADSDGDGLPDSWNADCDISCQENSGLILDPSLDDFDNDGLVDSEDNDNSGDNYPPTVSAPPAIRINATGDLTDVQLEINGTASANDLVDGPLAPSPMGGNTTLELAPGRYQIVWQATDNNNNTGSANQQVDVVPLAGFDTASQMSGEGNTVTATVTLNGNAPEYPVIIPVAISALSTAINPDDHDANVATIVIEEDADPANTGTVTFTTSDDGVTGESDETVILEIVDDNGEETLSEAVIDSERKLHTVTITEMNVPADITGLTLSQGEDSYVFNPEGPVLYELLRDNGDITIIANLQDANPDDSHTYQWIVDETIRPETGNTIVLRVDQIEDGDHSLSVQALDNGNPPEYSNNLEAAVAITTAPALYGNNGGGSGGSGGGGSTGGLLMLLLAGLGWRRGRQTQH